MQNYNRRDFLRMTLTGTMGLALAGTRCAQPSPSQPNIILILVDDLGYSDLGCYGSEINTPNLDQLAQEGMQFTQFYNAARCCPTRASLLTGLYPHQTGVGHMTDNLGYPAYQGHLNDQCVTIASVLKAAGYRTGASGKWHVGAQETARPLHRGFDRYYGLISGACNYFKPEEGVIWEDDHPTTVPTDGSYYTTDAFTEHAVDFIRSSARDNQQPFFLYLAYNAPHYPLQAWPEDIKKYRGKYLKGWDQLREERYQRMVDSGLIPSRWELSPRDSRNRPWSELTDEEKEWRDQLMSVYAAMVDRMDQGVGKVLNTVEKLGIEKDTLIFFLSDNGACPYPNMWGDQPRKDDQGRVIPVGGPDATYAYGWEWANAGNTPFRKYKRYTYEGGISTPLIVRWPGVVPAGKRTNQIGHIIDIMSTCVDVAGASYPETQNGQSIHPMEGRSLMPVIRGKSREAAVYCWEHQGHRGVHKDQWKLVSQYPDNEWELYDLEADRTEVHNLMDMHPDIAGELQDIYQTWADRCGVIPWGELRKG